MEIKAVQKYIISSPKKLREIIPLVRKMKPQEAVEKLPFVGKRASLLIRKVIMTALSNAKQKNINPNDLVFKEIQVNEGPRLKRFRAGARGRVKPYKKRMSHIRVVLTTVDIGDKNKKPASKDYTQAKRITRVKLAHSEVESDKLAISRKGGKTQFKSVRSTE